MGRILAILALLSATACSSTSSSRATAVEGGADGGPACVAHDAQYTCLGETWSVCPSTAQPEQPCDNTAPTCMACSQGAGLTCFCADAGVLPQQDGSVWECIGTEYTCE